jgi:hypothetical protein
VKLFKAGNIYSDRWYQQLINARVFTGDTHFLCSYGTNEGKSGRIFVERLGNGITCIDCPDEIGEAFLKSGEPMTVEGFRAFLRARHI